MTFPPQLHLIFETLGFFVGFRYFLYLRKTQSDTIPESNRIWILIGATFGAFIFSRLIGAFEHPRTFITTPHKLLYLYANKTIVGALLGGLLCVELTKKVLKETRSSGDLFTYPLILAMMIGRIGCFTSGLSEETYGLPTTLPIGIDLGDGIPRHPVSLYEIIFLGLLWLTLRKIERNHPLKSGYLFQFFMIAYLLFRLLLDFIKPRDPWLLGLSTIQATCIIGLTYYSKTIWKIFTNFSKLTDAK